MNQQSYKLSSALASPTFAVIMLIFCGLSAYVNFTVLSGYLFFLCLLSTVAYLWGRFSAHDIAVDIDAPSHRVYPDQMLDMHFTLQNNKFLPLIWLEWTQSCPPNACFAVSDDFTLCEFTDIQNTTPVRKLCKRFSFIRWYETITWVSQFRAVQRGVYLPKTVQIATGDGFGLGVHRQDFALKNPPVFVVYPKRVSVSVDTFFKNAWSASTGPQGVIEDVTVLRGIRDYQQTDAFKRINWRMAARSDQLSVNIYDTISPRSVYFLVDTATFSGIADDNAQFEHTLSIIASLLEELCSHGMSVSLYLPADAQGAHQLCCMEGADLEDCLLALSYTDCANPKAQFDRQQLANLQATQSGMAYYVCYDATQTQAVSLFDAVGIASYTMLSYLPPADHATEARALALSTLERK